MDDQTIVWHAAGIADYIRAYCLAEKIDHGADIAAIMAVVTGQIIGETLQDREALERNWAVLAGFMREHAERKLNGQ